MNILIDMQGLQTPFSATRGVGNYIEGIVRELHQVAGKHHISYLFNAEFPDAYFSCKDRLRGIVTRDNSRVFTQKIIHDYYSADERQIEVAESFCSAFIESLEPDVLFSPNLQEGLHDQAVTSFAADGGRFVQIATLHDMVPMYMEEQYLSDPSTRRWYGRKIRDAARCDKIVTVSETSKRDIEIFVGVDACRVVAIPNGFDADRFNPKQSAGELDLVHDFLSRDGEFILYFGGADKHKNIGRLVEAYASMPRDVRRKYSLVLGGRDAASATDVLQMIIERGIEPDVILPGYIPDELLPAVIRQAALFVFPSTHEGFGLPPLEAMACGTPTLGSDTSAVGEILQNHAGTFDAFDVRSIASAISKALMSEEHRADLREQGIKRASHFSWRRSASELLVVMEEENARRVKSARLYYLSRRVGRALTQGTSDLAKSAAATIAESAPEPRQRRVYLDASSVALYGGNSGIQRVVREVARYLPAALKRCNTQVKVVYAEEGGNQFRALASLNDGSTFTPSRENDELVDFAPSDTLVFLDLHPGLAIRMEHQVQRMRALGIKVNHVVYDILPVLMPEKFWPELQEEFYRWLQCISRSDGLLCISRTVAEQTAEYLSKFGVKRPDPLLLNYFPLGSDFSTVAPQVNERCERFDELAGEGLTFLVVGTLEPRKAHDQVLLAFEQAWQAGKSWRLVFVGRQGWKMDRLGGRIREHAEFAKRLFWHEKATDELLHNIYELADCIICASEGEGFGLPLIEAARLNKPVIARDIPVFREVAGDGAFYFPDERRPEAIKGAIENWIDTKRTQSRSKSTNIRAHSWKQAAAALAAALNRQEWPLAVQPLGALDLKNPVSLNNSNLHLTGFYRKEGGFRWIAPTAWIEFETVEAFERVNLELECFSWRRMPFELVADGKSITSAIVGTSSAGYIIDLPALGTGRHRIELRSKAGGSPPNDNRALGIAIKQLKLVAIQPLSFDQWVNVRDLNISWHGFSGVEFDWRWTTGTESKIEFSTSEECPSAVISIFGRAAHPSRARFVLNGETFDDQKLPTNVQTIELAPAALRRGLNVLEIHLDHVRPFSDQDSRELGLRMLEFKISRAELRRQPCQRQVNDQL